MKYVLGIPFVNRPDMLERAIQSVKVMWPNALIVDNSDTGLMQSTWQVPVLRPPVSLTFSLTMNLLQRLAKERCSDVLLVMHNDAEAGSNTAERLLAILDEALRSRRRWGVAFTHYDALVAFSMSMVEAVGSWDANLPQYFSDNDYYRRVRLANYEIIETGLEVRHDASSTLRSDARRTFLNAVTFPLSQRYYAAKWGGAPGRETYDRPFNLQLAYANEAIRPHAP